MNQLSLRSVVAACVWLCCACSIDAKAHQDYKPTCDTKTQDRIGGLFCISKAGNGGGGGKAGAGSGGASAGDSGDSGDSGEVGDAGPDSGRDAGVDAGEVMPPESCEKVGAGDFCYPTNAPMSTAFQPPCRIGTRVCGADHFWGMCTDYVVPSKDVCDGLDNDCDGNIDEQQTQMTCTVGGGAKGVCAEQGFAICREGGQQDCLQATMPSAEKCNGKDDDCDGKTDEGLDVACYGGTTGCTFNDTTKVYDCVPASTCAPGTLSCVNGKMQTACANDMRPSTEIATVSGEAPRDEDCDGLIDEGFDCQSGAEFPCYTGPINTRNKSPCKDGKQVCGSDGKFGACTDERRPMAETCGNEGTDDDCDGMPDNVPRRGTSCESVSGGMGACKTNATWQCEAGAEICRDGQITTEVCDGNQVDEDCDGKIDEGFDLQADENNCGRCGNKCASGLTCCTGACVSTASSNSNCGTCGNRCGTGLTCCTNSCVNLKSNNSNCGKCGQPCLLGCSNGGCNLL